jgi:hypothetical protein
MLCWTNYSVLTCFLWNTTGQHGNHGQLVPRQGSRARLR